MEKITAAMAEFMESEISRRIKDYPIKVFVGGDLVDVDDQTQVGDEIHISIENPVFFSKTGMTGFVTIEKPKRMAE